ncbi:hypothetical protein A1O1_07418 [Capronia coronata CBS 617.96]|uniref:Copper acquisition factor BIM1-like domain-containing protein n=1 Tax=Capronia coronata CBS 617.96 TaxID=1182541 RepID=W9Y3H2_9EURO|nr:uncharacterized protein A1O1_07418 [Capronia coronata CBS 617.96]EXJ83791.1 hypothetical protein A1O1_07418 [Capronia coronata CBS 617.96]
MLAAQAALLLAGLYGGTVVAQEHGEDYAKTMGPVAFLWPSDRIWDAAHDNSAPCGTPSGVTDRTEFPLLNGQVALVAQDESYSIQVAVSYKDNPTSNDDFETVIASQRIPSLAEGHQCYPLPSPPADVEAGANATVQIKYIADFDTDESQTFYACADITYVPTSAFTYQVPCFNATVDDYSISDNTGDDSADATTGAGAAGASATAAVTTETSDSSSSGLSGGAIAGIVVGVVAGVAVIIAAGFLLWRRSQIKKRARQQAASVRAVDWEKPMQEARATA